VSRFATIRLFPYSHCRACGFTFANPIPSDEVLGSFYNSPFYNNYKRLEARRIARERYFSISMYTDMRRLATWLGADRSLTVLDYGCSHGAFLALLRDEFGFSTVEGLEISRDSVEFARRHYGLTVASATEELRQRSYDFVLLFEVIEHLPNPGALIERITGLVKPGGCLMITTPAVDNPFARYFPSSCPYYGAPIHISLFTRQALTCLLSRSGFRIERIEFNESPFTINIFEQLAIGLFYDLDFLSPANDHDSSDLLWVPNAFGRLLGLKPGRSVEGSFGRGLHRVAHKLARLAGGVPFRTVNDHLYVMFRKDM